MDLIEANSHFMGRPLHANQPMNIDDIKSVHLMDTGQHPHRQKHKIEENKEDDLPNGLHRDSYSDAINEQKKNDFTSWDCNDILEWILSLEQGLLVEYKEIMMSNMKKKNVVGANLMEMEMQDIRGWGIEKFDHIKMLQRHIKSFTNLEGR